MIGGVPNRIVMLLGRYKSQVGVIIIAYTGQVGINANVAVVVPRTYIVKGVVLVTDMIRKRHSISSECSRTPILGDEIKFHASRAIVIVCQQRFIGMALPVMEIAAQNRALEKLTVECQGGVVITRLVIDPLGLHVHQADAQVFVQVAA